MKAALMAALVMTGCTTIQGAKVLTLPPHDAPVTVTAVAQAKCYDILTVMMWCKLNMAMESSSGEKVSDFPPQ